MKKIILSIFIVMSSRLNGSNIFCENMKREVCFFNQDNKIKNISIFFVTLGLTKLVQGYADKNFSDFTPSLDLLWDNNKKRSSALQYTLSVIAALWFTNLFLTKSTASSQGKLK